MSFYVFGLPGCGRSTKPSFGSKDTPEIDSRAHKLSFNWLIKFPSKMSTLSEPQNPSNIYVPHATREELRKEWGFGPGGLWDECGGIKVDAEEEEKEGNVNGKDKKFPNSHIHGR